MNVQPAGNTVDYILDNYSLIFTYANSDKSIPLRFLDYLQKSQITSRNILKIPINFKYFFNYNDGIPIVCIQYNNVYCGIKNNNNNQILEGASLVSKKKYLYSTDRRELAQNRINNIKSREINTIDIQSRTNIAENIMLTGDGLTNGFILQIENEITSEQGENIQPTINNIENICYKINGHERHNFNANLIDIYCQKLLDNAIYFPLNLDTDLLSEINSNALNFSRIDITSLTIITNLQSGFKIKLFFIVGNAFTIQSGLIGNIYSLNPIIIDNPNNYNSVGILRINPNDPNPIINPNGNINGNINNYNWIALKIDFPTNEIICPITRELLNIDNGISRCNSCNNIFDFPAFKTWIETSAHHNCPICRNFNIQYNYYTITGDPIPS
jgi:hypothetical protein